MNITLKSLSVNKRCSEETNCFSATVYVDGKKAGDAHNNGTGGQTMVWFQDRKLQEEVEKYCQSLSPHKSEFDDLPMSLDFYIDLLVEEELKNREYRRWCKNKLVFRLKGDCEGEFRTLKSPYTPEAKAWVMSKYKDEVEYILNERI